VEIHKKKKKSIITGKKRTIQQEWR